MTSIPAPQGYSTRDSTFDRVNIARQLGAKPFVPIAFLGNRHAQTMITNLRPRRFHPALSEAERREFHTEPDVSVVAFCSWQPERREHPTLLVVHGLEGSAEAGYVLGTAGKAFSKGFNVLRFNVRNCGGTEHMTPTLYHSGLTIDLHLVLKELIEVDRLEEIFLVGFSMGANQSLKLAGELGSDAPEALKGICAISPPVDLEHCSRAIGRRRNFIYENRFLRSLKKTMRIKARLFPDKYDLNGLDRVRSLWDFDELISPYNGFAGARDYYTQSSSGGYLERIRIPTLIIHAKDDPFIPMTAFVEKALYSSPWIIFLNPAHGGHVAFCGKASPGEDRAWAENRAVEFCHLVAQH